MVGKHVLKTWSTTQAVVALSSGESELCAALKGGCELLSIQSLYAEWGKSVKLCIEGDSAAAKGAICREGLYQWASLTEESGKLVYSRS